MSHKSAVKTASPRFRTVANRVRAVLGTIALAVLVSSTSSLKAQDMWQIDASKSVAKLYLGSGDNLFEAGVARVSGNVTYQTDDPGDPGVNFRISSEGESASDYAQIRFASDGFSSEPGAQPFVTGQLSVTRITRSVTVADPNEAYAGPLLGEPITHSSTRWIDLPLSSPVLVGTPALQRELTISITASRETFPDLLDTAIQTQWPTTLVNDERCTPPAHVSEDYSGPTCFGSVIASVSNQVTPIGTPGGEDYSGYRSAVTPDQNDVTIVLMLKLKKAAGLDLGALN